MMPNRRICLISAALLAGCAPPQKVVYIDVDRALAMERHVVSPAPQEPAIRFEAVAAQGDLPAEPSRVIANSESARRSAAAQRALAQQRAAALERIERETLKALSREIERYRLAESQAIDGRLDALFTATGAQFTEVIQRYADRRWPLLNRLALLTTFPLRPIGKIPVPAEDDAIGQKRYSETAQLYSQLSEIDRAFRAEIESIYGDFYAAASKERLDLGLRVLDKTNEAEARARAQARAVVDRVNSDIALTLKNLPAVRLQPAPGRTVNVASGAVTSLPVSGDRPAEPSIITVRQALESDARVWAASHGYRLASSPNGAIDETERFIQWRQHQRAGR